MTLASPASSLGDLMRDELRLLVFDRWLLFSVSLLPAGLFLFMLCVFHAGIVHELPVAVVDMDHSALSRSLIRCYDASSGLTIQQYASQKAAASALRSGRVYGIIYVPGNLEQDLRTGRSPQITVFDNFQTLLIGKSLESSLVRAHATYTAQMATLRGLGRGNVQLVQAQGIAVTTRKQITPLYNMGFNYAQFLITGLLPAIWQILMVAVMILVWFAEERRRGIAAWLQTRPFSKTVIRLVFYQAVFLVQGVSFLALFLWQGWPFHGGFAPLFLAQWLTILACQAIGTVYALCIAEAPRAFSMAASYTAPGFAFIGVTFPATDMGVFPQMWRALLPVSHYMEIQIGILNYGVSPVVLLPSFRALCCFLPLFLLVVLVLFLRRRAGSESASFPVPQAALKGEKS
ncbi:MAG: multidrug ABC transporter permease [Deltaproteobacteria bacterium]|nr:MAG: multidrug ABC transporter permease [Deltaproteobacteria bacterium]